MGKAKTKRQERLEAFDAACQEIIEGCAASARQYPRQAGYYLDQMPAMLLGVQKAMYALTESGDFQGKAKEVFDRRWEEYSGVVDQVRLELKEKEAAGA